MQWHRQPNDDELRDLLNGFIKEELLAREAKEMGLDENDTIVRRRLAQKMEFIMQDAANLAEPKDDELRRLYDQHRADYQVAGRISFTQIYFKSETAALAAKERVTQDNAQELGDISQLERDFTQVDERTVVSVFGPDFVRNIFDLPTDQWHGPLASGYGYHLVRISERLAAIIQPFEQVREKVAAEWQRIAQARASEQFFEDLRKKYEVKVDDSVKALLEPVAAERK